MEESNVEGASVHEQTLAAVRADNEDSLLELFEKDNFDINCVDALGNTPLHLAAAQGSIDVLEHILTHEECDVDPINRVAKATPLHLAVQLEPAELRHLFVKNLLEAGADTNVKDRNGDKAEDLIPSGDEVLRGIFRKSQTQASFSQNDIANDSDGESGSGSGEV